MLLQKNSSITDFMSKNQCGILAVCKETFATNPPMSTTAIAAQFSIP